MGILETLGIVFLVLLIIISLTVLVTYFYGLYKLKKLRNKVVQTLKNKSTGIAKELLNEISDK